MWLTAPNRIGDAAWQCDDSVWRFQTVGGGQDGIALLMRDTPIRLVASDGGPLPPLLEQYVRSDQLHLSFPQCDGCQFGFRLAVRPVFLDDLQPGPTRAIFEFQVSIETTLLDSHPTLDLVIPGSGHAESLSVDGIEQAAHRVAGQNFRAAALLSPQDAPFTTVDSQGEGLRLRLFGGFLEKGVIRRARPWLLIDRSGEAFGDDAVRSAWAALASSPLPLG